MHRQHLHILLAAALAQGKLRVLYECFPMAMLVEQAGGKATTGTKRSLETMPDSIHDRCVGAVVQAMRILATLAGIPCRSELDWLLRCCDVAHSADALCRAPIYLGSKEEVELIEQFKKEAGVP